MVAFASPSGWTVRLVPQPVNEGLPDWLESLTGRFAGKVDSSAELPAWEITDRADPAPWRAGRPLDHIPERLSLSADLVRRRSELHWARQRIWRGRAEVTAFEIRCNTPPRWIEPLADASPVSTELHRVLLASRHATMRARALRNHRDLLVSALHALGHPGDDIAALASITRARVAQIAHSQDLSGLDARVLDQLVFALDRRVRTEKTPREMSMLFAKHKRGTLHARERVVLIDALTQLLHEVTGAFRVWKRRRARIEAAAAAAIGGARRHKMAIADIARRLEITTKTVRQIEDRHPQSITGSRAESATKAVDFALADMGRLDLIPAERRAGRVATARQSERRTSRARERNVAAAKRTKWPNRSPNSRPTNKAL